jgi:hypothetical protein
VKRLRARGLATIALLLVAGSCGHGPPEGSAEIGDYDTPPGAGVMIALRSFDVVRSPRGLSAFPDGGFAIGVDEGVEVNLCERGIGTFRQIAVLHERPKDRPSFSTPMIVAWLDTAVRITKFGGGDTVVRLPAGVQVGHAPKQQSDRSVLPECAQALDELRRSRRMPDGTPMTR